jgi:hypothetical protein
MFRVKMFRVTMFRVKMFRVTMFRVTMFSVTMFGMAMFSTATFGTTTVAPNQPMRQPTHAAPRTKGGRWYFAAEGHAVYCYGPVMTLPQANGDLQKVATFCKDGRAVVPLKD